MKLTYHWEGEYLIPDLFAPESPHIGIWGERRRQFLRKHQRPIYDAMLRDGTLSAHLEEMDREAEEMMDRLMTQMVEREGISEILKTGDSYVNNPVEIVFNEAGDKLIVDIKSYSPYCSKTDIENIFQKGFRGKNAIKVADGSGIGLFFVKLLCDLHNIQITISSDNSKVTEINGVAYAPFNAQLVFSDTH